MNKKFIEVYPEYDKNKLPNWIQSDIDNVVVTGKREKTLIAPDGRKYDMGNKLNDLSGSEWIYFTNSVINTNFSTTGKDNDGYKFRKIHPSPKPPKLMKSIIEFCTKENENVLDFFMGVGGTLIGASMCNRKATGIDLNKNYINAYKEASKFLNLDEQETIVGDALKILKSKEFKKRHKKFSLVLIDPPYSNMMNKEKTGEDMKKHGKSKTPFTTSNYDLGNMNKKDFLNALRKSVEYSLKYLEESHYVVVFIKDMQPNGKELNLLHCDVINELNKISNLQYKGMKIWADQTAKLFPYGYPFSFVSTQIHQYILFFRKEKE